MSPPQPLSVTVSRVIPATPESIYDVITDITRMPEFSPETVETAWLGGATSAAPGARFKGTNKLGSSTWSTKPTITAANRGERFSFRVPGKAGATWTYEFVSVEGGTRVTESMRQDRPSPAPIRFLQRRAGVTDRAEHLRDAMATTLDRLAVAVAQTVDA